MQRTWKTTAAGVLSIIAGIIGIGAGTIATLMGEFGDNMSGGLVLGPIGVPTIILGVVAIIGGIFALRRRVWWLAVTGAIFAIPCVVPVLGTLAIIFIALAREEFAWSHQAETEGK